MKTSLTGECTNLHVHLDPFWRWKNIDTSDRVMRQHIMWVHRKVQDKRFVFTPLINHRSVLCKRWIKPECHLQFPLKARCTCTWWIAIQTVILLFAVVLGQKTLCPSSLLNPLYNYQPLWLHMSKFINIYQSLTWICVSWKLGILLSLSHFNFAIILQRKTNPAIPHPQKPEPEISSKLFDCQNLSVNCLIFLIISAWTQNTTVQLNKYNC